MARITQMGRLQRKLPLLVFEFIADLNLYDLHQQPKERIADRSRLPVFPAKNNHGLITDGTDFTDGSFTEENAVHKRNRRLLGLRDFADASRLPVFPAKNNHGLITDGTDYTDGSFKIDDSRLIVRGA